MCHVSWAHRRAYRSDDSRSYSEPGQSGWGGFMAPSPGEEGFGPGGGFGVRRPLRFLAHKLDLDEKQVVLLARILDELKTERAQVAVDDRRTLADFADALGGEKRPAEIQGVDRHRPTFDLAVPAARCIRAWLARAATKIFRLR